MKSTLICLIACLLISLPGASDKPLATAARLKTPPVIDGKLDDACWGNLVELSNFTAYQSQGQPAQIHTAVKVGFDDQYLYLGFRCRETVLDPVLNQLQLFKEEAGSDDSLDIYQDENVEIFIDAENNSEYRYLILNPAGRIFDASGGYANPENWNSNAIVKTSRDTEYWYIEAAIPLNSLTSKKIVPAETVWRVNFCRNRSIGDKEISSWSPAPGGFHQPSSFGELHFAGQTPEFGEVLVQPDNNGRVHLQGKARNAAGTFLQAEVVFDNQDKVIFREALGDGPVSMNIRGASEQALTAIVGSDGDGTETVLKSGNLPVEPGKEYIVSAVVRADFSKTDPLDYNFFLLLPLPDRNIGYLPVDGMELTGQEKTWRQISGRWKVPTGVESAELWLVKWHARGIKGTLNVTDISIKDPQTGRELVVNGDFSQNQTGWPVLQNLGPGYGHGSSAYKYSYSLIDGNGREIYRSAAFRQTIRQIDRAIGSTLAYRSERNILPLTELTLCTGELEKVSLFLRSDQTQPAPVALELKVPEFVRLFSPAGQTAALPPLSIEESPVVEKYRLYTLKLDPQSIGNIDDPDWAQPEIPLLLTTSGPWREQSGLIQWRAILSSGKEEQWQNLPVSMLPPLPGRSPQKLPLVSWAYQNLADMTECTKEARDRFILKQRRSGFNHFCVTPALIEEYRSRGGIPFDMLPTATIVDNFPFTDEFLKQYPQHAAVMADGSTSTHAVCPSYLLTPGNEYLKTIRKVLKYFTDRYDHVNWDYEFPFMPGPGCQTRAQIGFSPANLELFRQEKQIPAGAELNATTIFEKYPLQWRDFRNRQNAEAFRIYRDILRELKPGIFFSAYSGYPPHSDEHYGIDWRYVSPYVDLVMAGYGGNNQVLMDQLAPERRYQNSGVLIMDYFDPTGLELNLGGKLADAGSYMIYYHFLVDGRFFLKSGRIAAIAADFEDFFLNVRGNRRDELVECKEFSSKTIANGNEFLVLFFNQGNSEKTGTAHTGLNDYAAVDHETGEILNSQSFTLTIPPQSVRAVYLLPKNTFDAFSPPVPTILPVTADRYPILRWSVPSSALLHYQVRYSRNADMSDPVTISNRNTTWAQIAEPLPAGKLFYQVQATALNGKESAWSQIGAAEITDEPLLKYRRPDGLFKNAAGNVRFWHRVGGSGTNFDFEGLKVENPFKTYAFWSNCHDGNGGNLPVKVAKNETLTVTARAKTADAQSLARIQIRLLDNNRNVLQTASSQILHAKDWTELKCTITAPENAIADILLWANAGTVQFNNVQLELDTTKK